MKTFEKPHGHRPSPHPRPLVPLLCALALSQGCVPSVDLKRMTYETLRREDCRLNQLDEFCQRNFANEYVEYERLRRHFMLGTGEEGLRRPPASELR